MFCLSICLVFLEFLLGIVIMRDHTSGANVEERLRRSQMELQWIQRQLAIIGARNKHNHHLLAKCKSRYEVSCQQATGQLVHNVSRFRLLEERNRALRLEVATLRQEKQQYRKLRAKLHAALQEKNRLNLELITHHLKTSKYDQVRSDCDQLRQTLAVVSQERDVAQQQKSHLQGRLENLEQVLKQQRLPAQDTSKPLREHMQEAVELKQQLQTEHEQALVALHTKQKEINQLQKVKVCDLEQRCRSQSEHFHQLSNELLNFRLQSDTAYIPKRNPDSRSQIPLSSEQRRSQVSLGFEAHTKTGNESASDPPLLISRFLPRQPQTGDRDRQDLLSVKHNTVTTDRPSSPRQRTPSEMEDEASPSPRSKPRYTGQVRLCTARYSYNPYDGPNEHPEAELPLVAGKYLYVYGNMDDDGFYQEAVLIPLTSIVQTARPATDTVAVSCSDSSAVGREIAWHRGGATQEGDSGFGPSCRQDETLVPFSLMTNPAGLSLIIRELLDGQRGLVPSNFVEFVQDKEKLAIQAGDGGEERGSRDHMSLALVAFDGGFSQDGPLGSCNALVPCSNGTGGPLDPEDLAEDVVPYPRKINLIKQLARSVIVGWEPSLVPLGWGNISGYNVLVDGELRASVAYGGRTKSLLEKLDLDDCVHRVSVQSATERGLSDELRCTLLVGANVVVAPCGLRVDDIQRDTAELSWLPSNSNYGHTVFLDGAEHAVVKPGRYRLRFINLKPLTVYKVSVVAKPHQVPWQLPLEQRERKEAGVEFCTQAAGPPQPPLDVQVLCGQAPGVLQVRWKPPILSPTGTSNGANVVGYAVCTKGQRIAEVLFPMADYVTVELTRIQCLEAREVIVRTLSVQGESQDSQIAVIPNNLLVPAPAIPLPPPMHPHADPSSPTQADPSSPSFAPHILSPCTFSPASPTKVPGPSTNCLCYPTLITTLYLRDQYVPETWMPKSMRPTKGGPSHRASLAGTPLARPPPSLLGPCKATLSRPLPLLIYAPPPPRGFSLSPEARSSRTPWPKPSPEKQRRGWQQRVARATGGRSDTESRVVRFTSITLTRKRRMKKGLHAAAEEDPQSMSSSEARSLGGRHNEEYHSESSRGSDLSDIMEEDEEELYSEMQLEEGRRRNSHNTPKNNTPGGRHDREGRRVPHGGPQPQRRPLMVPSIEVTSENNSEGNPVTEDVYGRVARHKTRSSRRQTGGARSPQDGYRDRDRRSPTYYDESEPEESFRIFVALFDYDPLSMSPNPDAADEELPFKEGQIIRVYGDKDTDGFYRAEVRGRMGLIPCNMVSEIRAEDEETMDQLIKQGFLPLSTPVDRLEQHRRGLRRDQAPRRMVALYDYDPRESSPNVDTEAELTFCAGDIMAVFGDIDEDGFYYGEINGHRGLVPSNFLEEVPDDVEVYLTDTPSHQPQEEPANRPPPNTAASVSEGKRVATETTDTVDNGAAPVRAPSPIARPLLPGTMRPISPARGPRLPLEPRDPRDEDMANKKKKGLLSKGKKLLKRLSPVK
ncbi:RIMS-binding protein 2 [Dissostichus eleginoides]|uniref:RIMS-binding protein 2 n=1 Tax=Dissostichus eleginoides TaxID=100907 RepID=A0AAD9BIE9_DISEL|nr:RIMS-binding protein 2 [Dissostichus eleginoides]